MGEDRSGRQDLDVIGRAMRQLANLLAGTSHGLFASPNR